MPSASWPDADTAPQVLAPEESLQAFGRSPASRSSPTPTPPCLHQMQIATLSLGSRCCVRWSTPRGARRFVVTFGVRADFGGTHGLLTVLPCSPWLTAFHVSCDSAWQLSLSEGQ